MDKWKVSKDVYNDFEKLLNNEKGASLYEVLYVLYNDRYDDICTMYPTLSEHLFNAAKESETQLLFAKAWLGEIELVKSKKLYLIRQKDDDGLFYVDINGPYQHIKWTDNKYHATRFTADEYPHYKNDFMEVIEVDE